MPLPTYPLATGQLTVDAVDVAQAVAWRHGPGELGIRLGVGADGWLATGDYGYLGRVVVDGFPDMLRIFQSGYLAGTTGRLIPRDDGSGGLCLSVDLPAAPFLVPVGQIAPTVEVLGQGAPLDLDLSVEVAPCQMLVELDAVGQRLVALYNGHLVGGVVAPPAPLIDAVRSRRLAARAFIADGEALLDISTALTSAPLPPLRVPDPPVQASDGISIDQNVFISAADLDLLPATPRSHRA